MNPLAKRTAALILSGLLVTTGCASDVAEGYSIPVDPAQRITIAEDLSVRHISEGVFEFTHSFPWPANSLAVVIGDQLVLVDTPYTPAATVQALDWLEETIGEKRIVAINTHFHIDNLGGNQALVDAGIAIFGSDLTVQMLQDRGQASLEQAISWTADHPARFAEGLRTIVLTSPTEVFPIDAGVVLDVGGESVEVSYPGPGHAIDNVVVYFPHRKVLFGGCLVIGGDEVGNTNDADLASWPDSLRNLERFAFTVLVPGHGDRLDPELLEHSVDLVEGHTGG